METIKHYGPLVGRILLGMWEKLRALRAGAELASSRLFSAPAKTVVS